MCEQTIAAPAPSRRLLRLLLRTLYPLPAFAFIVVLAVAVVRDIGGLE